MSGKTFMCIYSSINHISGAVFLLHQFPIFVQVIFAVLFWMAGPGGCRVQFGICLSDWPRSAPVQ